MATASKWVAPGDAVRVRGARWRVVHVAAHEECAVVELAGAAGGNRGEGARFILPFETMHRLPHGDERPRVVRPAAWRRVARAVLADAAPAWTSLRAAGRADLTLFPYQLEPALAMVRGLACRFLLADEVGLGKTIQAGLLAAELLAREPGARILILTPAGLREQWRDELRERFQIDAELLDAGALARAAARLPAGVNPWEVSRVAIASIDFVKRPDVIRALEPLVWDLVAFDEAHGLAGRSDRAAAADLVARRARRVAAITATPHGGDDRAFERLCALGRLGPDDPMLMFRRSRTGAGIPRARSFRLLHVRPTPAEAALHRALDAYARRVTKEAADAAAPARLAMIVLARRACSSAASLARSAERRMSLLAAPPDDLGTQLRLPIDDTLIGDDEEPVAELSAPGLDDARAERRWLERIVQLASAVTRESKIEAVARLLRRAGEPAIVFTQYRDTLQHLFSHLAPREGAPYPDPAPYRHEYLQPRPREYPQGRAGLYGPPREGIALLHGGLTARERAAEARRFTHGDAALLLATDAASEGLNLQRRCRLVINLDVPWTPLRLEQRIGRVDRLGQSRRVHAVGLVARATSDAAVATSLGARAVHAAEGAPFDDGIDLREEAEAEARRLHGVRAMLRARPGAARHHDRPVLAVVRRRARGSLYLPLRLLFVDADGGPIWDTVVAPVLPCAGEPPLSARDVRTWVDAERLRHAAGLAAGAAHAHEMLLLRLRADLATSLDPLVRRERAIADALRARHGRLAAPLVQAGLFDRRALRDADAQHRLASEAIARAGARLAHLERMRLPSAGERRLVFAVVL